MTYIQQPSSYPAVEPAVQPPATQAERQTGGVSMKERSFWFLLGGLIFLLLATLAGLKFTAPAPELPVTVVATKNSNPGSLGFYIQATTTPEGWTGTPGPGLIVAGPGCPDFRNEVPVGSELLVNVDDIELMRKNAQLYVQAFANFTQRLNQFRREQRMDEVKNLLIPVEHAELSIFAPTKPHRVAIENYYNEHYSQRGKPVGVYVPTGYMYRCN